MGEALGKAHNYSTRSKTGEIFLQLPPPIQSSIVRDNFNPFLQESSLIVLLIMAL